MSKIHEEVVRKNDEKMKNKLKKEFKEMKIKQRAEHKVIINNHVDKENFDQFFNGIKDLFVSIFGS